MSEKRTTLIEGAGENLEILDERVRDIVSLGVRGYSEYEDKIIFRATNSQFLTKDAVPELEDRDTFIGALLERYIEAADTVGEENPRQREAMIAQVALALDVLMGGKDAIQDKHLAQVYKPHVAAVEKEGLYIGWLRMFSESARMIRDDIGLQAPVYKKRKERLAEEDESEHFITTETTVPEFKDLRNTIIDLVHDECATKMTPDTAAALLVAFGIEKPRRPINPEKLKEYKTNALKWVIRELSFTENGRAMDKTDAHLRLGRNYLSQIARLYPLHGEMSATTWLAVQLKEDKARPTLKEVMHVESFMAFALHDLMKARD